MNLGMEEYIKRQFILLILWGNTSLFPAGRTWERELELTRNHRLNHGPIGLHFDLFDNMSDVNDASLYPLFKEKKQFRKSGGLKYSHETGLQTHLYSLTPTAQRKCPARADLLQPAAGWGIDGYK